MLTTTREVVKENLLAFFARHKWKQYVGCKKKRFGTGIGRRRAHRLQRASSSRITGYKHRVVIDTQIDFADDRSSQWV